MTVRFLVALTVLTVLNTPARAELPTFTPAWEGNWDLEVSSTDCLTGDHIVDHTGVEVFCAGQTPPFTPIPGEVQECEAIVGDESITVSCSAVETVTPGCDVVYFYNLSMTRSGETFQAFESFGAELVGSGCFDIPGYCEENVYSGQRTSDDYECGLTPIASGSWGELKHTFR